MRKVYPPNQLKALRAMAGSSGISQQDFATLVCLPLGTVGSMENRTAKIGRAAAEKIEAVCLVSAESLMKGKLLALDGKPYTARHWKDAMSVTYSSREVDRMETDIVNRVRLLLYATGSKKAGIAVTRMRQALEALKEELGVSAEAINTAGQKHARVAARETTVGELRKDFHCGKAFAADLKKYKATDKVSMTYESWEVWPESKAGASFMVVEKRVENVLRAVLPDSRVLTHRSTTDHRLKDQTTAEMWKSAPEPPLT